MKAEDMATEHVKICIIGAGPAGFTAAIYAARANLEPLVFEGGGAVIEPMTLPGGQLMITTEVENYPGFPTGIMGPELMGLFRQQIEHFGTKIIDSEVTKIDFSEKRFRVWVDDDEYQAHSIIVSTGASAKWIGIPSEITFGGFGVSACAPC